MCVRVCVRERKREANGGEMCRVTLTQCGGQTQGPDQESCLGQEPGVLGGVGGRGSASGAMWSGAGARTTGVSKATMGSWDSSPDL